MKIKKLLEAVEDTQDVMVGNSPAGSDIADAIEAQTDGEMEITNDQATDIAAEADKIADEINAVDTAVVAPKKKTITVTRYETENALTASLDQSYKAAMAAMKARKRNRRNKPEAHGTETANVLVIGLPGSGKTSIVKAWAANRDLNFVEQNVKDPGVQELLFGSKVPDHDKETGELKMNELRGEELIKKLHKKYTVLFLDEYNRGTDDARNSLLDLINKKEINSGSGVKLDFRDSLLFTVAAINPSIDSDRSAKKLTDAEKTRFGDTIYLNSTPADTKNYLYFSLANKLDDMGIDVSKIIDNFNVKKVPAEVEVDLDDIEEPYYSDESDREYVLDQLKITDLGVYLVSDSSFIYDGVVPDNEEAFDLDKLADLHEQGKTMLNQRYLVMALVKACGDKKAFEDWVNKRSNLLDNTKDMLLSILRTYTFNEAEVCNRFGINLDNLQAPAAVTDPAGGATTTPASDSDPNTGAGTNTNPDFEDDGDDDDTDIQTNPTGGVPNVQLKSGADIAQLLRDFKF